MQPKRTLIIGDIHGNIHALEAALEKANYCIEEDRIICLGDYIDGWKNSYEVIELLIKIQAQSPFETIFIKGNHDQWFLDVLNQNFEQFRVNRFISTKFREWLLNDGTSTYRSYLQRSDDEILRHKELFFDHLKLYHLENEKLFVHAGFDYYMGFEDTLKFSPEIFLWDRSLFKKAVHFWQLQNTEVEIEPAIKNFGPFKKIYIGHTPTIKYNLFKPIKMGNVINVDQGCKTKGILSIWVDETDTYFQHVPISIQDF